LQLVWLNRVLSIKAIIVVLIFVPFLNSGFSMVGAEVRSHQYQAVIARALAFRSSEKVTFALLSEIEPYSPSEALRRNNIMQGIIGINSRK